jgi:hypothetical protein
MERTAVDRAQTSSRNLALRAWDRWRKAAHAIGVVQTRFLMLLIYIAVVLPTGLFMRALRDPLRLRHPTDGNWSPAKQEKPTIETARRQF